MTESAVSTPNRYPQLGAFSIIPAADLADADSAANVKSAGRVGDESIGKKGGTLVIRDNGTSDYDLALSLGSGPTDAWIIFGRESTVTPS